MAKYFIVGAAGDNELWLVDIDAGSVEPVTTTGEGNEEFETLANLSRKGFSVNKGVSIAVAADNRVALASHQVIASHQVVASHQVSTDPEG